jgi:hypothetical protein
MNSPSTALVWELWRKNRWGFIALLILLGVCALASWQARRLQARAVLLTAHDPNRIIIPADRLTPPAATGPPTLHVTLGPKVVFDGRLLPNYSLLVEGHFEHAPQVRLTLKSNAAVAQGYGLVVAPTNASDLAGEANSSETPVSSTTFTNLFSPAAVALYDGPLRARAITWSVGGGATNTVFLDFDPSYPERVASASSAAQNWREAGLTWSVGLLAFSVLIILGIFGAAEPHARLGFTGLPPRRFTLPVSTATLVAWPIGLGCLTVALVYFAWSRIVSAGLLSDGDALADGYYFLLLMTGLVLFQALVWGLPSFPKTRAWLITLLVLGLIVMAAVAPVALNPNNSGGWENVRPWLLPGLGVACASGIGLAWVAANLERRGTWSGWTRFSTWSDCLRRILPRPLEFRSPAEAQFWMEWRRNGRLALAIWTGFVCLLVACDITLRRISGTLAVFDMAFPASFAWTAIIGLNLARDPASGRLALSSFTAVRPVATGMLVRAKLMMGASLWARGMIILGLGWLMSLASGDQLSTLPWLSEPAVVFLAVSLHVFIGILPFCLTGRLPGFPWSLLPLLLVYGALVNLIVWTGEHRTYADLVFALVVVLSVVKAAVAFWGFRRAIRLRISSWQFVAGYAVFWLAAASPVLWIAWRVGDRAGWSQGTLVMIPGAVLVVPLARVALSPLALAMNRHR